MTVAWKAMPQRRRVAGVPQRRSHSFLMVNEGQYIGPPTMPQLREMLMTFALANVATPEDAAAVRLGEHVQVRLVPWTPRATGVPAWRVGLQLPGRRRVRWLGATHDLGKLLQAVEGLQGWKCVGRV